MFRGFATVERNDSIFALHYYEYTFYDSDVADVDSTELETGARVYFALELTSELNDSTNTATANITELTGDITKKIVRSQSDKLFAANGLCTPQNIHITRDYRRLDYFNITAVYTTKVDNDDEIALVFDEAEQVGRTDSVVVLWLRHYQKDIDNHDSYSYSTISVPLNELITTDSIERLVVHTKWLDAKNDTIEEQYIYSYKNTFIRD